MFSWGFLLLYASSLLLLTLCSSSSFTSPSLVFIRFWCRLGVATAASKLSCSTSKYLIFALVKCVFIFICFCHRSRSLTTNITTRDNVRTTHVSVPEQELLGNYTIGLYCLFLLAMELNLLNKIDNLYSPFHHCNLPLSLLTFVQTKYILYSINTASVDKTLSYH